MDKVDFEFVSLHVWMLMAQTTEHTGKYEERGGGRGKEVRERQESKRVGWILR